MPSPRSQQALVGNIIAHMLREAVAVAEDETWAGRMKAQTKERE